MNQNQIFNALVNDSNLNNVVIGITAVEEVEEGTQGAIFIEIGEQTVRIDITDQERAREVRQRAEALRDTEPPKEPSWVGLLQDFAMPGNALYDGIQLKVAELNKSDPTAYAIAVDRFSSVKEIILQPMLQDPQALVRAIAGLRLLVDFGEDEVNRWNDLMKKHSFPDSCFID